jgi:hypothetical protein
MYRFRRSAMNRIWGLVSVALVLLVFASPLKTQGAYGSGFIRVGNHSNYDAHITIYSLNNVRIERSGRVAAHSSVDFSDGLFAVWTHHHVRFQWMTGNRVLCDTSMQVKIDGIQESGLALGVTGVYDGGSHCHINGP